MVEIMSEEHKVKIMKITGHSLTDFWDNIKCTIIQIIGVPEEEEKKKGYKKIFEEIEVQNFPNMEKEIVNKDQEAQKLPYRINPRRNTPRHIVKTNTMLSLLTAWVQSLVEELKSHKPHSAAKKRDVIFNNNKIIMRHIHTYQIEIEVLELNKTKIQLK